MSSLQLKRFLVASLVGGSMLASGAVPASSAVLSMSPRAGSAIMIDSSAVTQVAHRNSRYDRYNSYDRYDRRRHGPRYSHQRRGYTHYRDGYWYRVPFWALAIPFAGVAVSHNSRHASWCDNRYRSYSQGRDAYRGYDGRWHRCDSPYN